jgi:hypothetical protein
VGGKNSQQTENSAAISEKTGTPMGAKSLGAAQGNQILLI